MTHEPECTEFPCICFALVGAYVRGTMVGYKSGRKSGREEAARDVAESHSGQSLSKTATDVWMACFAAARGGEQE